MPAYLLLLAAILSRVVPHSGWYGFTAVGGSLLYFGAPRRWQETVLPVAALAGVDYYLTAHVYGYEFHWQAYLVTWVWYAAAIVLGRLLLALKTSTMRVASAAFLGPTSFFLASNYAVWLGGGAEGMYPHTMAGLIECLAAGLPFYARDLVSTGLVATLVFGVPAMVHRFQQGRAVNIA